MNISFEMTTVIMGYTPMEKPMGESGLKLWRRYAFALLSVTLVVVIKLLLDSLIERQVPFQLFLSAVVLSAWLGGFGAGVVAVILTLVYANYFFFPPLQSFAIAEPSDILHILIFFAEGMLLVFIASLLSETRQKIAASERAKDEALALLDAIQIHAPFGLSFLDRDLRYVRINHAMAELNGLSPAAHVGQTLREVQPQLSDSMVEKVREVLHTGTPLLDQEMTISKSTLLGMKRQHLLTSYYRVRGLNGEPLGVGAVMIDITERKRAEERLRESEQRFRSMADTAPVLIWMSGLDKKSTYFNKTWLDFTGRTLEQERGDGWIEAVHPDDRERCLATYRRAFDSRKAYEMEYRLCRHDGQYRWVVETGVPRQSDNGRFMGYIGSCIDIHERKQAEMNQAFLLEASTVLSSSLNYDTTLSNVARLAVPNFADWCAVDMLTDNGSVKRLAVTHVDPEKVRWAYELEKRYPIDMSAESGLPKVLKTGKAEFYPEITEAMFEAAADNPETYQILRDIGFTSLMIVPLVARGRTLGAITFVSAESKRHYTQADLVLAEELAAHAALAVDNARLYEEANAERERLRVTLASIGDAVIATDETGRITFVGAAAEQLTGWNQEEAKGRPLEEVFKIVNEYSREPVENPVEKVLREGVTVGLANHTLLIRRDGLEIPIDDSGAPIRASDGSITGVVLVFRTIDKKG